MYELLAILAIEAFLAYKLSSSEAPLIVYFLGLSYFLYLGAYSYAELLTIFGLFIALLPSISLEDYLDALALSFFFSRLISSLFLPNGLLFLLSLLSFLVSGAIRSSLASRSLALLIALEILDLDYARITSFEAACVLFFFLGIFIPKRSKKYALYAGELERPMTLSIGVKVVIEASSKLRYSDVGTIVEGRILIDFGEVSIVRRGPALILGKKIPIKPRFVARRKPIEELISLESVSIGPVEIIELEESDYISIGPRKIRESSKPMILSDSRKLRADNGILFESPEGFVRIIREKSSFVYEYKTLRHRLRIVQRRDYYEISYSGALGSFSTNERSEVEEELKKIFLEISEELSEERFFL